MNGSYGVDAYVADLRRIAAEGAVEGDIFDQLGPLAVRLAADKTWLKPEYWTADPEQGFGVRVLHEEADHSLAILVVAWDPGKGVPPHDHGTWAIITGIDGIERNVTYARRDDRSQAGHAEIDVKKEANAGVGDLICIKTGGIHSVSNDTDQVTLSLHTYGKHPNHTVRSQFDREANTAEDFTFTVE